MIHIRQSRPDSGLDTYKTVKARFWPWIGTEKTAVIVNLRNTGDLKRPESGLGFQAQVCKPCSLFARERDLVQARAESVETEQLEREYA